MKNVGFIGVGYMGYGIAKNILKHKNKLFVIANKNRKPIEKIVSDGAEEVKSFEDFSTKNLDAMFMCVTNTPIAKLISEKISDILDSKTLIIDITTHNKTGSMETEEIFKAKVAYKDPIAISQLGLLKECELDVEGLNEKGVQLGGLRAFDEIYSKIDSETIVNASKLYRYAWNNQPQVLGYGLAGQEEFIIDELKVSNKVCSPAAMEEQFDTDYKYYTGQFLKDGDISLFIPGSQIAINASGV